MTAISNNSNRKSNIEYSGTRDWLLQDPTFLAATRGARLWSANFSIASSNPQPLLLVPTGFAVVLQEVDIVVLFNDTYQMPDNSIVTIYDANHSIAFNWGDIKPAVFAAGSFARVLFDGLAGFVAKGQMYISVSQPNPFGTIHDVFQVNISGLQILSPESQAALIEQG